MNLFSKNKLTAAALALFLFSCTKENINKENVNKPITTAASLKAQKLSIDPSKILYKWDFEAKEGSLKNLLFGKNDGISVVTDPLDANNKVFKATILQGGDRTEVCVRNDAGKMLHFYADAEPGFVDVEKKIKSDVSLGHEFWISFRIYKPLELGNSKGYKQVLFQIGPVNNWITYPTEPSSGFWQLRVRSEADGALDTWNARIFGKNKFTPIETQDNYFVRKPYGAWEKFVLHFNYSAGEKGIIEVWKDGTKYITLNGPNAYPLTRARIQFGEYIGTGNHAPRDLTCYLDDLKIARGSATYEEMK